MAKKKGAGGTPATVALTKAGVPFTEHAYAHDPAASSYGLEAAELLGLPDVHALGELAATATRPDPPLLLPYLSLSGERSPFLDSRVRGSLLGLDLMHTPADVARVAQTDVPALGVALLTDHAFSLEIIGVLLLGATIGAVLLAKKKLV